MANYATLKGLIDQYITTNGQGDITGAVLNDVLKNIVNSIGADFLFGGVVVPSSNVGTPDQNVFYIAIQGGSYQHFNETIIPNGITIFKWNGSWSYQILFAGDGGVFDISAYHNNTKYAGLTDALGADGTNIPQSIRMGGMSIKFIQSSDNKYVQYRLMSDSFNTTVANWQGVDDEPTAGSDNLVKSGGVYKETRSQKQVETIFSSGYINAFGGINSSSAGKHSDYVKIRNNVDYYVKGSMSNAWYIAYYSAQNESSFISSQQLPVSDVPTERKLAIPNGAGYVRVSIAIQNGEFIEKIPLKVLVPEQNIKINEIYNALLQYSNVATKFKTGYINSTGGVNSSSYARYSDFVEINNYVDYYIFGATTDAWYVAFYSDANESSFISSIPLPVNNQGFKIDIPVNAKYIRVSISNTNGEFLSLGMVVAKDSNIENVTDFYVGFPSKNDNYSSVTECFYAAMLVNGKRRIHINSGTYDIFTELGGYEYVNQFTNNDDWKEVQPVLHDCEIIGYGNVTLMFTPANQYNSYWLFSPLNVDGNIKVSNINIECSNCRYGIHDEDSGLNYGTTREYENVSVNANGCRPNASGFSYNVFAKYTNCEFVVNSAGNVWSCHGNPNVSIEFNNCIFINSNGADVVRVSQVFTHNMFVKANNCYMQNLVLSPEIASETTENKTKVRLLNTNATVTNGYSVGQLNVESYNTITNNQ